MKAASQPKPLWLVLAGGIRLAPALRDSGEAAHWAGSGAGRGCGPRRRTLQRPIRSSKPKNAQKLEEYAWVDKAKGTVQIPIERAMELAIAELNSKSLRPRVR